MPKYFGTDGIRGIAFEKLTIELAFKLGQSLKTVLNASEIVIGMDTRESSPMLAYSIANGALALGVDVLFSGVVSTPMIAHYSKEKQIIGIMITASHNPYQDNGIKVFNKGYKTLEYDELKIEEYLDSNVVKFTTFGKFVMNNEVSELYKKVFHAFNLKQTRLKIAYDSANGANYLISNEIFSSIAPNSVQINNHPTGKNVNDNCGSTHIEGLVSYVLSHKMDLGFAFDGDGDRIHAVDDEGTVYDGDMIIYIIGSYLKNKNLLNKSTLVLTKMSNPGILKALEDQNIQVSLTDVGDKYVSQEMFTNHYLVGGESSGHIILPNLLHTGDGLLVATYLIKILDELQLTLQELTKDVKLYPIKTTNLKGINKSVLKLPSVISKIEEVKKELGKHSLLLVRASGTEDLIRVTLSSQSEVKVEKLTSDLVSFIHKEGFNL
jgi:phosphoglucosamine mutase